MKKFLIVYIWICAAFLFAQGQSASFGLTAQVNDGGDAQWQSQVRKDAILKNLPALEDNYLSKLSNRQFLEDSMLVEDIREILNGKQTQENTTVSTQTTITESSQSENINMNLSGFDTSAQSSQQVAESSHQRIVHTAPASESMNSSAFYQLVSNVENDKTSAESIINQ